MGISRGSVKASPAFGWRRLHTNTDNIVLASAAARLTPLTGAPARKKKKKKKKRKKKKKKNTQRKIGAKIDRFSGGGGSDLKVAKTLILLFELGIMDDFVQCRSNPRIKYFKIRYWNTTSRWRRSQFVHWINQLHFFDPLRRFRRELRTSTYLSLESYLPASEGCWCRELVKVKIRNLQSLLVCSIIFWRVSSTEDDWIFGWRSRLASQILILFWSFTFLRCRHMKRLLNCRTPCIQFLRIRSWRRCKWICKNVSRFSMCPKCLAEGPTRPQEGRANPNFKPEKANRHPEKEVQPLPKRRKGQTSQEKEGPIPTPRKKGRNPQPEKKNKKETTHQKPKKKAKLS